MDPSDSIISQGTELFDNDCVKVQFKTVKEQRHCFSFKCFNIKKNLRKRLKILDWIGHYNTEWAINDFIAGITLGLTIIPESIACALLAGLPANYGLSSAFMGSFIYLFLGSINQVIMGPTSLIALTSVQFTMGKPIEFAFLLTLFSGIVELLMGIFRLGFIYEFISMPVIKGFSSATAILVIESQLKVVLGIKYLARGLIDSVSCLTSRLHQACLGDFIVGTFSILFLIMFDRLEILSKRPNINRVERIFYRYLSFSRNMLVVLITAIISYIWLENGSPTPYAISDSCISGLPNVSFPNLTIVTPERTYNIWQILRELNAGIFVIPIVGVLTNISIGKLNPNGVVDSNQELFTVGICNIFGSCMQSMPTSGAFTRYAISNTCGLKTPMGNLYSGIIVLLALSYLSPYFRYIPDAALAAILICSIFTLLDFKTPTKLFKESKRDFFIWLICFIVSIIFGVEVGLSVSILITVLHLLFLWARPSIDIKFVENEHKAYISVVPSNSIYFPAISHFRRVVLKAYSKSQVSVVIDCQQITGIDYSAALGIQKLSCDLLQQSERGDTLLILLNLPKRLKKIIGISDNLVFAESEEQLHGILHKVDEMQVKAELFEEKFNK